MDTPLQQKLAASSAGGSLADGWQIEHARKIMATISTCSHCQNHLFELQEGEINGAHFKVLFVQCTSCGAPVGIMEGYGSAALLKEQADRIKNMEQQISHISSSITHISRIVCEFASQHSY